MKSFLPALLLVLISGSLLAQQGMRGANYYLNKPASFDGKVINLHVTKATSEQQLVLEKKYTLFTAQTIDGEILVAVPNAAVDSFTRRFAGGDGRPKTLSGTFSVGDLGFPYLRLSAD